MELFGIDSDSFKKTVLFGQNDLETSATDSINARLGNLTGITDDINNFESVIAGLKSEINHLSDKRSTGQLARLKSEENLLRHELAAFDGLDRRIAETDDSILSEKKKLDALTENIKKIRQAQRISSEQSLYAGKRSQYERLRSEYNNREQAMLAASRAFPRYIPETEELEKKIAEAKKLRDMEISLSLSEPTPAQEELLRKNAAVFEKGIPSEADISEHMELAQKLEEDISCYRAFQFSEEEQAEYDSLLPVYRDKPLAAEYAGELISGWLRRTEQKSALPSMKAAGEALKNAAASRSALPGKSYWLFALALGTALAVYGISGAASAGIRLPEFIAGLVLAAAAVISRVYRIRKRAEADMFPEYGTSAQEIARLDGEIESAEVRINSTEEAVRQFLGDMGLSYDEAFVLDDLYRIKEESLRFRALSSKKDDMRGDMLLRGIVAGRGKIEAFLEPYLQILEPFADHRRRLSELAKEAASFGSALQAAMKYRGIQEELRASEASVAGYIECLGLTPKDGQHFFDTLIEARQALTDYRAAKRELNAAAAEKRSMEALEDFELILSSDGTEVGGACSGLDESLNACLEQQKAVHDRIRELYFQKSSYLESRDELDAGAERLAELRREGARLYERLELLSLTKELLEEAKTNFTASYARPVSEAFSRYYEALEGHPAAGLSIDANSCLVVSGSGRPRDIRMFSAGTQDKLNICFRAALIDAMYKKEPPVLIMDDPFADLDEVRLAGAFDLLRMLSGKHQIIYLCCHGSRMP